MSNSNKSNGKDTAPGQNKETTIYVNTTDYLWHKKKISFNELTELAYPDSQKMEFDVKLS